MQFTRWLVGFVVLVTSMVAVRPAEAQKPSIRIAATAELTFPPKLPGGKFVVTDSSPALLLAPETFGKDVAIAKTPPTVDFLYYPGQDYEGKPWSNWGDGVAAGGKYYSAIGDHLAIGAKGDGAHGTGTALVFEYDPEAKSIRTLVNTTKVLGMPAGHYTPGKIHSRLDMGDDGWLYYVAGAHGGSERDGSPVVQFDTKTRQKKVLAFLHPFYQDKYQATLVGSFSSAVDPQGDKLYITWNVNRGGKGWDCCALTTIHLPASERP